MAGTTDLHVELPADVVDALRAYCYLTKAPAADIVEQALRQFLQANRDSLVSAAFETTLKDHEVALNSLKAQ